MLDMARVWPIFCQFGIGAALCAIGVWAGVYSGYLNTADPADRRVLAVVVAGYLGLLILSCLFTFWLPFIGVEGGS
jgi:hypothetical protein